MTASLLIPPIAQFNDLSGAPLEFGKVYTYEAGTLTPKVTYIDFNKSANNTNPIILDSGGMANIWLDGSYKLRWYDQNDVFIRETDNVFSVGNNTIPYFVTTGSPNAYIGTPTPPMQTYEDGLAYNVVWSFTNTGDATLDVSSTGARQLVTASGSALAPGALPINTLSTIIGSNSKWVVSNPLEPTEIFVYTLTGSNNAYVLTPTPSLSAYTTKVAYTVIANFTNTGACTLNISGLGTVPMEYQDGTAFVGGEIVNGQTYNIAVETTKAVVLNPTPLLADYYVSGGSANAYTITTSQGIGAYVTGMHLTMKANFLNSGDSTIKIDNLAAIPIRQFNSAFIPLVGGEINEDLVYDFVYDGTYWIIQNPSAPISISMKFESFTNIGFLPLNGTTFAKTSGGTYNNTSFIRAYLYLWNNLSDSVAPVSGGRGASALADWNANKNILLPDFRNYSPFGVSGVLPVYIGAAGEKIGNFSYTPTGSISGTVGTSGATTLNTTQIPSHTHTFQFTDMGVDSTLGNAVDQAAPSITVSNTYTTASTGGGGSHTHTGGTFSGTFTGNAGNVVPKLFGVYYYINY